MRLQRNRRQTDRAWGTKGSSDVLRAHGISNRGRVRPTNEDCFAIDEHLRLCVVADGMGGHNAGEVAARVAVDAVVDYVRKARRDDWPFGFARDLSADGNLLRSAIHAANLQVLELAGRVDAYAGMGTTLVAALVADGRVVVGHVGDSRLYLMGERGLRQLTSDDSWMASAIAEDPHLDEAVLRHHPMRNVLTNVVGARMRGDVHVAETALGMDERLVLTTDGVHGVLDDRSIAQILADRTDPADAAGGLVEEALARGSRDNCTAVVALYEPEPRTLNPEP